MNYDLWKRTGVFLRNEWGAGIYTQDDTKWHLR